MVLTGSSRRQSLRHGCSLTKKFLRIAEATGATRAGRQINFGQNPLPSANSSDKVPINTNIPTETRGPKHRINTRIPQAIGFWTHPLSWSLDLEPERRILVFMRSLEPLTTPTHCVPWAASFRVECVRVEGQFGSVFCAWALTFGSSLFCKVFWRLLKA